MFIALLVLCVSICVFILVGKAEPDWLDVAKGFIPSKVLLDKNALYIAIGIIGATVMPHNLYLHSHLVKLHSPYFDYMEEAAAKESTSSNTQSVLLDDEKPAQIKSRLDSWISLDPTRTDKIQRSIRYSLIDTCINLCIAFCINAAILIVAAASFHSNGMFDVADIGVLFYLVPNLCQDAHGLLQLRLGPVAGTLFAVSLLASGQSSTLTGTLAGQVVMEVSAIV